jgi:predicted metal-dependent HD superfamily phosphohydrolase
MVDLNALSDRWHRLFPDRSAVAAGLVFNDLVHRYNDPSRHYHTLEHIASVLDTIALLDAAPSPALLLAGWLHDVVYDSRAGDNEQRSADYALSLPEDLQLAQEVREESARLILLTKSHLAEPADRVGHVLLDADLAILGVEPSVYAAYAAAIRREYAWVSEADYRTGRRKVLQSFLSRPRIFRTPRMLDQAEACARTNLANEIAALGI